MLPTLTIKSELPTGAPGEDTDPWNPLARAVRALLHDGTRIRTAAHLYLADEVTGEISRWIGMVVEGESGRVMFFPALPTPPDRMRLQRARTAPVDLSFNVDHLTLEPDWKSWHMTQLRPVGPPRRGGPRTWDLGDGNVLWFGMTIGKDDALRRVKQTTTVTAAAPRNRGEAIARLEAFERAVKCAEMGVIAKPGPPPFRRALCHFSIILAPPTAPFYTGPERGYGGSFDGVLTALHGEAPTPTRSLWTSATLSDRIRIQVIATWVPGEMATPAVFYGRAT
jgi:hypothetical protein